MQKGTVTETFLVFLRLGLTSFGGPVAHLGAFQKEFVHRKKWLDAGAYADLVSLCQFLPGPASSQVGIAVGLGRAGVPGALAAFLGFTLPSAVLLFAFAMFASKNEAPWLVSVVHGLKVVAVAIVAHALVGMRRSLAPDAPRFVVGLVAALVSLSSQALPALKNAAGLPALLLSLAAPLAVGLLAGLFLLPTRNPGESDRQNPIPSDATAPLSPKKALCKRQGVSFLVAFAFFLAGAPIFAAVFPSVEASLLAGFSQAGAYVFGGGHVVLPFLQALVVSPGWVTENQFLSAYGAAQAVPGPLFTVATALGTFAHGTTSPIAGASLATAGIFLPAFLLVCGALPFWETLRRSSVAQSLMRGVNAAVFGLLAATFVSHIWPSGIHGLADVAIAGLSFLALVTGRVPTLAVVAFATLTTLAILALFGV